MTKVQEVRYRALDLIRGISIMYVVFIHASIYNYAKFKDLNIAELPLFVLALGAAGLWGGVFIFYSLIVNTVSILRKHKAGASLGRTIGYLVFSGAIYILLIGTIQTLFLGRWSLGAYPPIDLTVIAETLRGQEVSVHFEKLLTGSGIKTIGLSLLIVPIFVYLIIRESGGRDRPINYSFLAITGVMIALLSFLRIYLYGDWLDTLRSSDWLGSMLGSLFIADPYPGIAYLAYGFIGAAIGMMVYYKKKDHLRNYMIPLGFALAAIGGAGVVLNQPSFFGASWFWYFKVLLEAGLFVIMFSLIALSIINKSKMKSRSNSKWSATIISMSRISLTVYMLETLTSELLRPVFFKINSSWDESLVWCALLGIVNLILWLILATLWRRYDYKYSIEYFWVLFFRSIGKNSTKLQT